MGGNKLSKSMKKHVSAERSYRRFGSTLGAEPVKDQPLTTKLFLRLGTRVATVVAHYEHRPPIVSSSVENCKTVSTLDNNRKTDTTVAPRAKLPNPQPDKLREATILEVEEPLYEVI